MADSTPIPSLRAEAWRGARAGLLVGVWVLGLGTLMARIDGVHLPAFHWTALPWIAAALAGVAGGCAIARAGWTRVRSVYGSMCVGILAAAVGLLGVALLIGGLNPAVILMCELLAFPMGAVLGFADWHNLYRNVRPKRLRRSR